MEIGHFTSYDIGVFWIWFNFLLYLSAFGFSLYANYNFNTIVVGLIYLAPLIPIGIDPDNLTRMILVSIQNTVFGVIELVIFVLTVKPTDTGLDRPHIKQFLGHTLPIAGALIGLSYVSRGTSVPVTPFEWWAILTIFLLGSIFRGLAVYQLGKSGFKFDIVFREGQKLMTANLYSLMRHPSYTAMMVVIFSYALTTHNLIAGFLGMIVAWFGFQYRIYHEEQALELQFGKDYLSYKSRTGMWVPRRN